MCVCVCVRFLYLCGALRPKGRSPEGEQAVARALLDSSAAGAWAVDAPGERALRCAGAARLAALRALEQHGAPGSSEYAALASEGVPPPPPPVAVAWTWAPEALSAPSFDARTRLREARSAAQLEDDAPLALALLDWRHPRASKGDASLCDALGRLADESAAGGDLARGVGCAGGAGALAVDSITGARGMHLSAVLAPLSALDARAVDALAPLCEDRGVALVARGVTMGGLLTDGAHGRPRPNAASLTPALAHYLAVVDTWGGPDGGWEALQRLLDSLKRVGERHGEGTAIADIAMAWVLAQTGVGAVAEPHVARRGAAEAAEAAKRAKALALALTTDDLAEIDEARREGGSVGRLFKSLGDAGEEGRMGGGGGAWRADPERWR